MSPDWNEDLDYRVRMLVDFSTDRTGVDRYTVVLIALDDDGTEHTVRVYDNTHGRHDLHRHTRSGGKQDAETFHRGAAGDAMNTARDLIYNGYEAMIRSWDT